MRISDNGAALIKGFEGLRLKAYQCAAGVWTIGYGHTGKVDDVKVKKGMTITKAKADELLSQDLAVFEKGVSDCVAVRLNQNQFDALVSFAFNCGVAALRRSTLLKKLNGRNYPGAAAEFVRWCHAGGAVNQGLLQRREREAELFRLASGTIPNITLAWGSTGEGVRWMQDRLNWHGADLAVDGIFGNDTLDAVVEFQGDHELKVDGLVGPKTRGKLNQ